MRSVPGEQPRRNDRAAPMGPNVSYCITGAGPVRLREASVARYYYCTTKWNHWNGLWRRNVAVSGLGLRVRVV
jgi:hypothetical protein